MCVHGRGGGLGRGLSPYSGSVEACQAGRQVTGDLRRLTKSTG